MAPPDEVAACSWFLQKVLRAQWSTPRAGHHPWLPKSATSQRCRVYNGPAAFPFPQALGRQVYPAAPLIPALQAHIDDALIRRGSACSLAFAGSCLVAFKLCLPSWQHGLLLCRFLLSGCAISGALLITKTEPTKVGHLTLYISTVTASQEGGKDITFHCHSTIAVEQACPAACGRCHVSKYCAAVVDRSQCWNAAQFRGTKTWEPLHQVRDALLSWMAGRALCKGSACGIPSVRRLCLFDDQCDSWKGSARLTGDMRWMQKERIFFPGTPQLPSQGTPDMLKLRQAELAILTVSRTGEINLWSVVAP